jgi:putative ABC transport system permease protein
VVRLPAGADSRNRHHDRLLVGSRTVTGVSPIEATGVAAAPVQGRGTRSARTAAVLTATGFVVVLLGAIAGAATPLGLFVVFLGGALSFTGIVLGAERFAAPVLALADRWFGFRPAAQLAVGSHRRDLQRFGRPVIGLRPPTRWFRPSA